MRRIKCTHRHTPGTINLFFLPSLLPAPAPICHSRPHMSFPPPFVIPAQAGIHLLFHPIPTNRDNITIKLHYSLFIGDNLIILSKNYFYYPCFISIILFAASSNSMSYRSRAASSSMQISKAFSISQNGSVPSMTSGGSSVDHIKHICFESREFSRYLRRCLS